MDKKNKNYYNYKIVFVVLILVLTIATVVMALYIENKEYVRLENDKENESEYNFIITEPILNLEIDEYKDKITIENKTYDYFEIDHLSFGKVRPIVYLENQENFKINYRALDLVYMQTERNFEKASNDGTHTTEEEKKELNSFTQIKLLEEDHKINKAELDNIKDVIKDFEYVEKYYDYYYLIVYYTDVYGNSNKQYYIFSNEYGKSMKKYKFQEEEFSKYINKTIDTNLIYKDENNKSIDYEKIKDILLSEKSKIKEEDLKYTDDTYSNFPFGIK